jgi:hypothetical protein
MGRWGSIYSSQEPLGNLSPDKSGEATGQVRWTSLEFGEGSLKASQGLDKSDGGLWSPAEASEIWSQTGQVRCHHRTLFGVR